MSRCPTSLTAPATRGPPLPLASLRPGGAGAGGLPSCCLLRHGDAERQHGEWVRLAAPFVQPTASWLARHGRVPRHRTRDAGDEFHTPCMSVEYVYQMSFGSASHSAVGSAQDSAGGDGPACRLRLFDFDDTASCLERLGGARVLVLGDSLARRFTSALQYADGAPLPVVKLGPNSSGGDAVSRRFLASPAAEESWVAYRAAWRLDDPSKGAALVDETLASLAPSNLSLVVLGMTVSHAPHTWPLHGLRGTAWRECG